MERSPSTDDAASPRAPTQAEWDAMSPAERERVVADLPAGMTDAEMSPPEGDLHREGKTGTLDALRRYFGGGGRTIYIGSELTIYYPGEPRFAPDVFAVWDVPDHMREKWMVAAEGKGLDWVLEVHVGGDRRKDAERNVTFYAKLGIPEYFIYDRKRQRLHGYRLSPGKRLYEPILPQAGRYASAVLGLDLVIEGGRLRLYFRNAELLESPELIERLERQVAEMESRVDERLEAALRRVEEETLRAETAEKRLAELLAELERLKKGSR